jgi:hypothetical protein
MDIASLVSEPPEGRAHCMLNRLLLGVVDWDLGWCVFLLPCVRCASQDFEVAG